MNQDIILVSDETEHPDTVLRALKCYGMNVIRTEYINIMKAGLVSHSPAFLLLDISRNEAEPLLIEIADSFFRPFPYIMVSMASSDGIARAAMLRLGADICIENPINVDEVLAVINAVQRRERRMAGLNFGRLLPRIEYKDMVIDPLRRTVTMKDIQVALTAKEFDVLHVLAYHAGKVLTKEKIYKAVWGGEYNPSSTHVSDQISSIRRKLCLDSKCTCYIQTVIGVGYRFGTAE